MLHSEQNEQKQLTEAHYTLSFRISFRSVLAHFKGKKIIILHLFRNLIISKYLVGCCNPSGWSKWRNRGVSVSGGPLPDTPIILASCPSNSNYTYLNLREEKVIELNLFYLVYLLALTLFMCASAKSCKFSNNREENSSTKLKTETAEKFWGNIASRKCTTLDNLFYSDKVI